MRRIETASLLLVSSWLLACGPATPPPAPPPAPASDAPVSPPAPPAPSFENPGGMWLPHQLESRHAEQLKALGLGLDPALLSDPMANPLGAVVSLGGCSASFVSPEGLVITNHHCVTRALQYSSTPEQNLLENGYLAKTRADEKWNGPTARVFVTQSFQDVTSQMRDGIEKIDDDLKRYEEMEARSKQLVKQCEAKTPNVRCEVVPFYGGAEYQLIERLEIQDVRLVYAPPKGIGNYGGEVDNWRWPRHGGDFGFYRAYVGKDQKPAKHSDANVPYRPRHHLKLPSQPLGEGDLVMVAGYPGRTYRLRTADEVEEAVNWYYPYRIGLCKAYLKRIRALGAKDRDIRIKATPLERGLSNVLTYTQGAVEGLTKGGAAKQKQTLEKQLRAWIDAEPERKKRYGSVIGELEAAFAEREKTRDREAALSEMQRMSSLLGSALTIVRMAEERPKKDADRAPEYQERNWDELEQSQRALEKRYSPELDQALLTLAAQRAAKLQEPAQRAKLLKPLTGKQNPEPEAIAEAIGQIYAKSKLSDTETRVKLLKTATMATLRRSRDPMLKVALAFLPLIHADEDRDDARSGKMALLRPRYIAALRAFSSEPVAPDANGTLRVTYGTVRGYKPTPQAEPYRPFTVLSGVVKKHTGKPPFDAPEGLLQAVKSKKLGPYVHEPLADVPVDFLADLDITGGNSGSPTLNAKGELVGLAFDGNYEAMASDWVFLPSITRSIHVDVRYALWVMDAVSGADHLIREMGGKPAIE